MNILPKSIFFIGIAGIGVSALAQLAQARGCRVSGSDPGADPAINPAVARLLDGGAKVYRTHDAANITDDISLVVATAAVKGDNPEIVEAMRRGIRMVSRAEFLGELMAAHKGAKIAVGGTHGKTTTTAMLGVMYQEAGWNPTVFVGAEVAQLGGNVRIGADDAPFIAEACEAYDSFLHLKPDIAIVTNIEADHLDHYGDFEGVKASFRTFLSGVEFGDRSGIVYCAADSPARELVEELPSPVWRYDYGFEGETLSARVENLTFENGETRFEYVYSGLLRVPVTLHFAGRHNVLNAAAALTTAVVLGANDPETLATMAQGLSKFRGAERRQELLGDTNGVRIIDDYAHHPTEIRATIDALKTAYPNRRLVAVFQPHLYSRTRDFLTEFAAELSRADLLIVTEIYAARELPINGVNAEQIVMLAQSNNPNITAQFVQNRMEIPALLNQELKSGDIVLVMGAGDIREQGEQLAMLRQKGTSA